MACRAIYIRIQANNIKDIKHFFEEQRFGFFFTEKKRNFARFPTIVFLYFDTILSSVLTSPETLKKSLMRKQSECCKVQGFFFS